MKFRSSLLLGAVFAGGLAAGPAAGWLLDHHALPRAISSALAQAAGGDGAPGSIAETHRALSLFGDVFERVRADYVEPVSDGKLIENSLDGMLSGLDPHSSYMNPKQYADMQVQTKGEFGGLGIEVIGDQGLIRVVSPVDGTPAARAGMKPGDLILAVDGKSLDGISSDEAIGKMRGTPGTKVTLTVKRRGVDKPISVTMTREIVHIQVVRSDLYGKVGYIRVSSFNEETDGALRAAYAKLSKQAGGKLSALVLDLRNNPGGLLDQAIDVCDDFIASGEVVSTRARHKEDSQRWDARGDDITGGLPVVVMINGGSASASEIVAGALQDHRRAVLLGETSFGKGSVQTLMPVPGGGAIRLTTARYYTPSGRSIQGLGITPDVLVRETDDPPDRLFPDREADLAHALKNQGGTTPKLPPRTDLPAMATSIPKVPPKTWPAFDLFKPATDFQLQQAIKLAEAMSADPASRETAQRAATAAPESTAPAAAVPTPVPAAPGGGETPHNATPVNPAPK